jgi:MFS transporter, DHA1 family, multidrug resistance protein
MYGAKMLRKLTGGKERPGRAVVLASFLSAVGFSFVFPLLPLYIRELTGPGVDAALWSGLALAATPMAGAVVSPFWGWVADRVGYRPMLLRALVSTSLLIGLMALPNAPWQLVLLRALAGALGSFQAVALGAITSWSKPEDLSRAVSRVQMAQIAGTIVGPLAGGFIAAFFGIRFSALVGGLVIGLGSVLVAAWFHEPKGRRSVQQKERSAPVSPAVLWLPILTLLAVQFTDASFNPILPLLLVGSGMDLGALAGLVGLAAALSGTAAAVGAGLTGRLLKRPVSRRLMLPAIGALAFVSVTALLAPLPWGLVALRVVCGGLVAGVVVSAYSAGGQSVSASQRGSAYGWLSSSGMAGYAASPLVAGALAPFDLRGVLVVDALLCTVAALGWALSRRVAPAPAVADAKRSAAPAPPPAPDLREAPALPQVPPAIAALGDPPAPPAVADSGEAR